MVEYKVGDIVSLRSGSMKMSIELIEDDQISTVWCNEGVILRDKFLATILKKWEQTEEERDKSKETKGFRFNKEKSNSRSRSEKDRVRTGWDGKIREKKFFRKN